MRTIYLSLCCGALLLQTGCADTRWGFLKNQNQPPATLAAEHPTAAQLVDYLNQNSQKIQSIKCSDVDLDCQQGSQPFGLHARIDCQKPKNFRLTANVVGKLAVDMGSNSQEFWYWISKAEPPYLFHCSYQDMANPSVRMPFPFQPDWVLEAMGMGNYGSPDQYQVAQGKNGTIDLVQDTVNSQGQPVRKVAEFKRSRSGLQVQAYKLQNAGTRKEICFAYIQEYQNVSGATLPKKLIFFWPEQQVKLTMRLDEVTINQPPASNLIFVRQPLANVQTYDLARGPDAPNSQIRPAGGIGLR